MKTTAMATSPFVPERRSGLLRRLRNNERFARLEITAAAAAIVVVLRAVRLTVRLESRNAEALERCWREGQPVLMTFWHGRSLMLPFFYRGRGACIMNSAHRDGEIVTRALERFGISSTRGSSTRGGVAGLRGLLRAQRRGLDLALIPDGPRGPAGVAKAGAVELAMLTNAPIFPLAVGCSSPMRLPTWDRMMLPRPFSRAVLYVGDPLRADRQPAGGESGESGAQRRERLRAELERRLRAACVAADRAAGAPAIEET
ncbi:MAG TPA: lysophospholipid acyltransferase family protein [Candidatus Limnocylindrales bacterium]|nr:lysophospholipid acyltransferase family protein [Candidatus Limnocylindrales bacterium]